MATKKVSRKVGSKVTMKAKSASVTGAAMIGATKIQPFGDRVLVRQQESDVSKTASGIFIPDTVKKEKPERGVIIAVGAGRRGNDGKLQSLSVSVGDTIVFSKYGYDEVKINGDEYLLIREESILAVIKEK